MQRICTYIKESQTFILVTTKCREKTKTKILKKKPKKKKNDNNKNEKCFPKVSITDQSNVCWALTGQWLSTNNICGVMSICLIHMYVSMYKVCTTCGTRCVGHNERKRLLLLCLLSELNFYFLLFCFIFLYLLYFFLSFFFFLSWIFIFSLFIIFLSLLIYSRNS